MSGKHCGVHYSEQGGRSMNLYTPVVALAAIAAAFAVGSVAMSLLLGPSHYNRAKSAAYECGIEPVEPGDGSWRFPMRYYLTAMLFIVFDIEIVFVYPWAVSFHGLGIFALAEMALFTLTVFVAYTYVWRRGGLNWD
jgi:NADH-quinone oxidoreductase subunit A